MRRLARYVRHSLRTYRAVALRKLGLLNKHWSAELPAEVAFWENALRDGGRNWSPEEFRQRTDPNRELQDDLRALIPQDNTGVRILDVGAGPLTTLGSKWPGRAVEIVAIDPLAQAYDAMLLRLGIIPPVRTRFGHGEKLLELFAENTFDLAYASNALDHSYDPLASIQQMLAVVKPFRFVYLWHFANEGVAEQYSGLHQWNFDVRNDEFLIGDGRSETALGAKLAGVAEVACEEKFAYAKRVVIAKIKKFHS